MKLGYVLRGYGARLEASQARLGVAFRSRGKPEQFTGRKTTHDRRPVASAHERPGPSGTLPSVAKEHWKIMICHEIYQIFTSTMENQ